MSVNYGRHSSLPRNDFGYIAPGQLRGVTFNAPSQHLWAYQLGIWAGKHTAGPDGDPDNVTARTAIYATDASMNPSSRLGYSDAMTVSTVMNDQAGGSSNTADVDVVDVSAPSGVTFSAIPLTSGARYHLAVLGTVGSLGHAMAAASVITADNEKFYNRNVGLSQPPPSPFGSYVSSTEGHVTIWAVCDENAAPDTPTNLAPAGTINDIVPTFTADFADANEARGDYLNQYRIQVRRKSDSVTFWDLTVTASEAERTADAISRAYGGTTLVRGTTYQQRVQMSDHFNDWSDWTDWTDFTPANLGFITLDSDPTGKIDDNTPDFSGRWTHQAGTSMKTVQVGLLNGDGSVALQGAITYDIADVASSASPGTLFTVPWAGTGFSDLAWGTAYMYKMRGNDGTQWSDWSAGRTFRTNAAPSIPSNLTPNAPFAALTDYPLLSCAASDADDGTAIDVFARILDSIGNVIDTVLMAYNGTTGRFEYQLTSAELAIFGSYGWDAYSWDGTLYSGEKTSSATATKSPRATFEFADGPTVTVSSPTVDQVLTTSDLHVAWSVSGGTQAAWIVRLYDGTGTQVAAEAGTGADVFVDFVDNPAILNGGSYSTTVEIITDDFLGGGSDMIPFTVSYTPPDPVANVAAEAVKVTTDIWASAIRITHDQTTYGTDVWRQTVYTRWASGGPDAVPHVIKRITSPSQVAWTDYVPASGFDYFYGVSQVIAEGVETIISVPVVVSARVDLGGVVLCSVADPDGTRTTLRHTRERDFPRAIGEAYYQPSNGITGTTVRSRKRVVAPSFDVQLFDDAAASAATRRDELEALDIEAGTICYRDNHGRKLFVTMPDCTPTDQVPDWWTAKVELRAETYSEGES